MNETDTFLTALFGTKPETAFVSLWTLPGRKSKHCQSLDVAATYAAMMARGHDVYVGVGLRGQDHGTGARGEAGDVVGLVGLWADIDIAGPGHDTSGVAYPPDEASAAALVDALPLAPTLMVHSGHGLQPWWLFEEAYLFDDEADRERAATIAQRWLALLQQQAEARGWRVDSVADIARVLRVPGTWNRKVADAVLPVRLLGQDGPRYAGPGDFHDYGVTPRRSVRSIGGSAAAVDLRLDIDASAPADKLDALIENDPLFARTWRKQRREIRPLKDASHSGYDLSIASQLANAGWSDQEIVDAIHQWRRKHGQAPVGRVDYYRRTIERARSGRTETELLAAVDVAEAAAQNSGERIAFLRRELGIPLARVVRRGGAREKVWHFLVLDDGSELDMGQGKDLLDLKAARARILDGAHHALSPMKAERWIEIIRLMELIAEDDTIEDSEFLTSFTERLRAYTAGRSADDPEAFKAAVLLSKPFYKAGRVYLHANSFRTWLTFDYGERVEAAHLNVALRRFGFVSAPLVFRDRKNRVQCRRYWSAPMNLEEEPAHELSNVGGM